MRLIRGCLWGCGALLGTGLVGVLGVWFWIARAGSQRPTLAVTSDRSVAVVRLVPGENDPGIEAVRQVLEETVEAELQGTSGPIRHVVAGVLDRLLPTEATLSYEPLPGLDDPAGIAAFNPGGYTRLFRLFITAMNSQEAPASREGVDLLEWPEGRHWAFVGGTGITSGESYAVVQAIGRLHEGEGTGRYEGAGLPPVPDGEWDLTGRYRDASLLADALRSVGEEDLPLGGLVAALDSVDTVAFGVDFEDAEHTSGTVWLNAKSESGASALAEALRQAVPAGTGVDLSLTPRVAGTRVEVELGATGLADAFSRPEPDR